jgi:MYXO-CTERM domain-containing protein
VKRIAQVLVGLSLTALTVAHAAVQVVDTTAYAISYDDTVFSFSSVAGLSLKLPDALSTTDVAGDTYQVGASGPLLTLSAKSGYLITGVGQTLSGSVDVSAPALAVVYARTAWAEPSTSSLFANELLDPELGSGAFVRSSMADATGTSGKYLTLVNLAWAVAVDNSNGGAGLVSLNSYKLNVQTMTVGSVSPVPEPEGIALALAGVVLLALRRRVRSN